MSSDSGSTDGGPSPGNDEASHDALGDTHLGRSLKELIREIGREKEALRKVLQSESDAKAAEAPEEDFDPSQTRFDQALELAAASTREPPKSNDAKPESPEPAAAAPPPARPTSPPAGEAADAETEAAIVEVLAGFEQILRRFAQAEQKRSEARLAEWKVQLKKATMIVIKKQVDTARARWMEGQANNEAQLATHYHRLKTLADKVARQKAQIQKAKQELEKKLEVADRLHTEFDEIRSVLDGQIDAIDALEEGGEEEQS